MQPDKQSEEKKEFVRLTNMDRAMWKLLGMRRLIGDYDLMTCFIAAMSKPTKAHPLGATLRVKITYPKPSKRTKPVKRK